MFVNYKFLSVVPDLLIYMFTWFSNFSTARWHNISFYSTQQAREQHTYIQNKENKQCAIDTRTMRSQDCANINMNSLNKGSYYKNRM